MDERGTIWVLATYGWFEVWSSGQTRHEGAPHIRHIDGSLRSVDGIVIRPHDRIVWGDTDSWAPHTRRDMIERVALAQLAGAKL